MGELLLSFACELLDHELVSTSCKCSKFLGFEVLSMLTHKFLGGQLGKVGWDERFE